MASLCAILSPDPDARNRAEAMLVAAPHRGSQVRTVVQGSCALGVSEQDTWNEASIAVEAGMASAVAGTIDNLEDLARYLDPSGSAAEPTPASIILAGWRREGQGFVRRLRGVFSGAVTDGATLWCFRDQLGFSTLFYGHERGEVCVATEAKQVVAGQGKQREPDIEVLERIFFDDCDDDMPTALKGVYRLPKASVLEATVDALARRRYWQPDSVLETSRPSPEEVRTRFVELMTQAVVRTFSGSDVISLSGGIDSPAIAAFAAAEHVRIFGTPISALSALYPDQPAVDEGEYIRAVVGEFRIPLHTYDRKARPLEALGDVVQLLDGPVPKILTSDALEHYTWARQLGFRTMLTGEVAELVFDMKRYLIPHLLWHGRLRAARRNLQTQRRAGVPFTGVTRQLAAALTPRLFAVAYEHVRTYQRGARIPDWLDGRRIRRTRAKRFVGPRKQWSRDQLTGYIGPGLTVEAESILQAVCGIRVRRPWADVDLWEFFLGLPAEMKFPHPRRKALVRQLLKGHVPDLILERSTKTGFDDSLMARIDYAALRQAFKQSSFVVPGVDYNRLQQRLDRQDFDPADYMWAKDLAAVHAFAEPERVSTWA